jgi:hypothetical protein
MAPLELVATAARTAFVAPHERCVDEDRSEREKKLVIASQQITDKLDVPKNTMTMRVTGPGTIYSIANELFIEEDGYLIQERVKSINVLRNPQRFRR